MANRKSTKGVDVSRRRAPFVPNEWDELESWWLDVAHLDAVDCIAKAQEYGSRDLAIMTTALGAKSVEEALRFYLLGKVSRMFANEPGSDDTLKDIVTYAMMIRRVRKVGRWP